MTIITKQKDNKKCKCDDCGENVETYFMFLDDEIGHSSKYCGNCAATLLSYWISHSSTKVKNDKLRFINDTLPKSQEKEISSILYEDSVF